MGGYEATHGVAAAGVSGQVTQVKCTYCYREGIWTKGRIPSRRILDLIDEIGDNNGLVLIFSGGEPLLDPAVPEYLRRCRDRRVFPQISTNGHRLTTTLIDKLAEIQIPYLQISIDSVDRNVFKAMTGVDGVEVVKTAIKQAVRAGLKIVMRSVMCKTNANQVQSLIDFAENSGVVRLDMSPIEISATSPAHQYALRLTHADVLRINADIEDYKGELSVHFGGGSRIIKLARSSVKTFGPSGVSGPRKLLGAGATAARKVAKEKL